MKTGILSLVALVLLVPAGASAATLTYQSWSAANGGLTYTGTNLATGNGSNFSFGLQDYVNDPHQFQLDEFHAYDWKISGINLAGQSISSVTITINNIGNWSGASDQLFLHLLDTATNAGVTQLLTTTNTNTPAPPFKDYFTNYPTTASGIPYNLVGSGVQNLIPTGTANTSLNDGGVAFSPVTIGNVTGPGAPAGFNNTNISFNQGNGALQTVGGNFTYTFSAADITALTTYIANGSDIALGFSPDCHFWNNGVTLTINTAAAGGGGSVPEPATITLFLAGLAGLWRKKRSQK